jgi:hypothetical protein
MKLRQRGSQKLCSDFIATSPPPAYRRGTLEAEAPAAAHTLFHPTVGRSLLN